MIHLRIYLYKQVYIRFQRTFHISCRAADFHAIDAHDSDDVARGRFFDFTSTEVQCAQGASAAGRISPNTSVGADCYRDDILATAAEAIVAALSTEGFRFDASDLMPSEVGSGQFWTGMNEYMRGGPDTLDGVLEDIDNAWP